MKKKRYPVVNIGSASILTVFVVLAMVAFSTLTYMTARKDARFNQQAADNTREWYEASAAANEKIAGYEEELQKSYQDNTFSKRIGQTYSFSIPCGTEKELAVTLVICDPSENNGSLYRLTSFRQISTKEWKNEESPNLMDLS